MTGARADDEQQETQVTGTMTLQPGSNAVLPDGDVTLTAYGDVDVTVLVLSDDGRVSGDTDMVFYNQPSAPGVSVLDGTVSVRRAELRPGADRLVLACTPRADGATFAALPDVGTSVSVSGTEFARMTSSARAAETLLVLAELYQRDGGWRIRARGDGYDSGLAGFATDYGIDVGGDAEPVPASQEPAVAAIADPAPVVVSLQKAERISLAKKPPTAVIRCDLLWDGGSKSRRKRGADLDLYTLWTDVYGNTGCVSHADLGSLNAPPYVELVSGDSRTPGIETVKVTRPDLLRKVAFCVYSAFGNGTGSMKSYEARVVLSDGFGTEVTVPLYDDSEMYWVLVGTIEFTDSVPEVVQVEDYGDYTTEHRPEIYPDGRVVMGAGPDESRSK